LPNINKKYIYIFRINDGNSTKIFSGKELSQSELRKYRKTIARSRNIPIESVSDGVCQD